MKRADLQGSHPKTKQELRDTLRYMLRVSMYREGYSRLCLECCCVGRFNLTNISDSEQDNRDEKEIVYAEVRGGI